MVGNWTWTQIGVMGTILTLLLALLWKVYLSGKESGFTQTMLEQMDQELDPDTLVYEDEFQAYKETVGEKMNNVEEKVDNLGQDVQDNTQAIDALSEQQSQDHDIMVRTSQKVDALDDKISSMNDDLGDKIDKICERVQYLYEQNGGND